jgi:hypothetical protein
MRIGLPTAARVRVREKRRTRAAVDNPQPAEIAPYRTPQNCLNEWGHFYTPSFTSTHGKGLTGTWSLGAP